MKIFLSFLFVVLLESCNNSTDFQTITPNEFAILIEEHNAQIVDVRTVAEYSKGHIANAINLNIVDDAFLEKAQLILQKDLPVAVYCKTGNRSLKAAKQLSKLGYKVYNLDDGYIGWEKAKKPTEK